MGSGITSNQRQSTPVKFTHDHTKESGCITRDYKIISKSASTNENVSEYHETKMRHPNGHTRKKALEWQLVKKA